MRKQLSKSEIKKLAEELQERYHDSVIEKKDTVVSEENGRKLIFVNDIPALFYHDQQPVPTLQILLQKPLLKKVTVDMGAVKFVTSGADVMRPGITHFDEGIALGECVVIVDETHNKPLAVGVMLFSGADAAAQQSGKVIKIIHYVGDDVWKQHS